MSKGRRRVRWRADSLDSEEQLEVRAGTQPLASFNERVTPSIAITAKK